ncbi:MAG: response regulator transcription factor [Chloroflexi bacterium]|nr:response regulator transcription factor [Chloroflexota bacterium]
MSIRVVLADDQMIVLEGLRGILKTAPSIEVVGVAHNGAEVLELIPKVEPDVVVMDLKMPVMNGVQATHAIHEQFPEVKVLVLTTYNADDWVFEAIRAGASGYLLKDTPREGLIEAIEGTAAGKTHVDSDVAGKLFDRIAQTNPPSELPQLDTLSERELDVLRHLSAGLSNADIADQLALTEGTVRNYVSIILAKLDVRDRTQAALLAQRAGLTPH